MEPHSAPIFLDSKNVLISSLQGDEFQMKLNQLLEMFPDSCTLEVSHCLNLMAGDIEEAAQLIIQRQESGQSLQQKKASLFDCRR